MCLPEVKRMAGLAETSSRDIALQIKNRHATSQIGRIKFFAFALKKQVFAVSLKIFISLPSNCLAFNQCYE